ncbi:TetR/AcrR family transcriptional regulator [Shewanella sp. WXL01]|uniref:TetR/AcrR family transcriptional regulator n=1 Tax=Shewanella maritima TaxID=2520507 RepID=A0A411PDC0_9GAMM|nr:MULTISPECIES: TetR/AcrR family transcriptional regulator [Shewanella]NKF50455.1 TetR/AcrR family transcriptional regulator [Shewanella sp. WXL01]QBF81543.1 TetR/AcrR family transcriptional regulator [Shewanella maritima]
MQLDDKHPRKVGRPTGKQDNRDKIIAAARELFIDKEYSKVTMRDIAELAGSDPGLIRYYFGAKDALFITMIKETSAPVLAQIKSISEAPKVGSLHDLMNTYYQVMAKNPKFPRLMHRLLSMAHESNDFPEIAEVANNIAKTQRNLIFDSLKKQGALQDDVNVPSAQLSFFSLMVFPFLAPKIMLDSLGIQITPEFLTEHAKQNNQLLTQGLFKAQVNPDVTKETSNEHQ